MANNTLLASDNFASGSLAAGWGSYSTYNKVQVVAGTPNVTEPNTTGTFAGQVWSSLTWPNDHASEVTINAMTQEGGTYVYLLVRNQGSAASGYYAFLLNSTVELFVQTAGTPTQLGSTVTGLTIAAGDVWTLQAAGSVISLYQNGNRVIYATDTTWTGGCPGYGQIAATNVNHCKISSWRGYNAIQQDGIWTKQGVVFAPNAVELTAANAVGLYEGCCIYDSNPQILAGPNVYKLWYSAGNISASANSYYAESPDLVNWTRYSGNPVISGFTTPQVIKVGSTYYLYCQAQNVQGTGNIAYYTSPDGVNFTQQSTNVLALGGAGAWDHVSIYPLKPIAVINGTWYALYGASGTGTPFKVGLATSTDGAGAVWAKSPSNPVLSFATSVYPYPCFANVNGTYYVWMQRGPSASQGASGAPTFDPTSCVRYATTNFVSWLAGVSSVQHSQMQEALNVPVNGTEAAGGVGPIAIFDIGGQAHMLYGGSQGDATGPVASQYQLAIAPGPISGVVSFNEDAVTQTASDSFTGGAGPLSANWTSLTGIGTLKIVAGNKCEPNSTGNATCGAAYTAANFGGNQYSEITIATLSSSGFPGVAVLINTATVACYYLGLTATAGSQIFSAQLHAYNGTTDVPITPAVGITVELGDVLRLSVVFLVGVGNVVSLFQNGSLVAQGVDTGGIGPTSGYPGMLLKEALAGQTQLSTWAGGNANVFPAYPSSGSASWLTTAVVNSLRGLKH